MNGFRVNKFNIEYMESRIDELVLWERHCHAQFEMIAVADGDVNVLLEGTPCRLKRNQLIIIPPLCYHSVSANGKGSYRRITALFDIDAIPEVIQPELRWRRTMIVNSPIVDKIRRTCQQDRAVFYEPLLESLMIQIFYEVMQQDQSTSEIEADEFLQQVIEYIDTHLYEKILLDDLAKATARSKSSFCHLFEEKMKISPKQYILQKKLALATKLIDEGMPHSVVAKQLGYENYSNFYRLYRKNRPQKDK